MTKKLIVLIVLAMTLFTPAGQYFGQTHINTAQAFIPLSPPPPSPPLPPPPPPPPPPTIVSFSPGSANIAPGQTTNLNWNVSGATSISIAPIAFTTTSATGTVSVTPAASTTYTLSATNANGTSSASTTVSLNSAPSNPTIAFQASDGACNVEFGIIATTSGGPSQGVGDSNNFEANCATVYLNSVGPFSRDFRIGIAVGDQIGGSCALGNFGSFYYTPWASQGGGWTGWGTAPNYDPDCYKIDLITQTLPAGIVSVNNVHIGVQMAEGNSSCYVQAPSQPGFPTYSYGGWSPWASAGGSDTPDCARLFLSATTTSASRIAVTSNNANASWTWTLTGGAAIQVQSAPTNSGAEVDYQVALGTYTINAAAIAGYTMTVNDAIAKADLPPKPTDTKFSFSKFIRNLIPKAQAVALTCDISCTSPPPPPPPPPPPGGPPPPPPPPACSSNTTCTTSVAGQVINFYLTYTPTTCIVEVDGFKNGAAIATGVGYTLTGPDASLPATSPNETNTAATQTFTLKADAAGTAYTLSYSGAAATVGGNLSDFGTSSAGVLQPTNGITDAAGAGYGTSSTQTCSPFTDATNHKIVFNLNFTTRPILNAQ